MSVALQPSVSGAPPGPPGPNASPTVSSPAPSGDPAYANQPPSAAGGNKPGGPPGPNGPAAGPPTTNGGSNRPLANATTIQKMLDENSSLIKTISEYENLGKHAETMSYQRQLHRNLLHLAQMADANQNLQNLLPPPGQVPPPGGMPAARPPGPPPPAPGPPSAGGPPGPGYGPGYNYGAVGPRPG